MEQTDLRTHCTAGRLAFADHMNRFIPGDRAPSSPEGAEMLTGVDPSEPQSGIRPLAIACPVQGLR